MRQWVHLTAAGGTVLLLLGVATLLRNRSGIQISGDALDQLRELVTSLGIWGPVLFLVVATFRVFFVVPSWILLTVGGMAFGAVLGALLGTLGVTLSGLLGFGIARFGGRGHVQDWIRARYGPLQSRLERAGLAVVAATTAHPAVPMSGLHWAAGLTTLPVLGFVLAVGVGAAVRSSLLAFLGASFREVGLLGSLLLGLGVCVLVALPLLHGSTRHKLLGRADRPG